MTKSARVAEHCFLSLRCQPRGDSCVLMALCSPPVNQSVINMKRNFLPPFLSKAPRQPPSDDCCCCPAIFSKLAMLYIPFRVCNGPVKHEILCCVDIVQMAQRKTQ